MEFRDIRVMIIDGNPKDLDFAGKQLTAGKFFKSYLFPGSDEAFIFLNKTLKTDIFPDVVVIDLNIHGLSGVKFLNACRNHTDPKVKQVPIIILTADLSHPSLQNIETNNITRILGKPFDIDKFKATFKTMERSV